MIDPDMGAWSCVYCEGQPTAWRMPPVLIKIPVRLLGVRGLVGGRLRLLDMGERSEMIRLERELHETLPLGREERQSIYIKMQIQKGLKPPPY